MITDNDIKEIKRIVRPMIQRPMTYNIVKGIAQQHAREALDVFPDSVTTTDATPTAITTINVEVGEGGIYEFEVFGIEQTGTGMISGIYTMHIFNPGGGININPLASGFQDDIGAAAISITDTVDTISLEVTGIALTTIDWYCYSSRKTKIATALP